MSTVRLTCPHCSLSRELPAEKVPDRPVQVTCPRCKGSFSLRKSPGGERAPGPSTVASTNETVVQTAAAKGSTATPEQSAVSPPTAAVSAPQPPARQIRAGTPPGELAPSAHRQPDKQKWSRAKTIRLVVLLLLLTVSGAYYLRENFPFQKVSRLLTPARQVITIPQPSGPLPAAPPPGSLSVQVSPAVSQADSAATPSTVTTPSSGRRFEQFDIYVFIYAVNAPGKVKVNGRDYKEIKDEPDMQYSINAFGDPFRYGSNTIEFELAPQQGGSRSLPPEVRLTVSRTIGSERKTIGEWRMSDKDGWKRSVTLDIPEVSSP